VLQEAGGSTVWEWVFGGCPWLSSREGRERRSGGSGSEEAETLALTRPKFPV